LKEQALRNAAASADRVASSSLQQAERLAEGALARERRALQAQLADTMAREDVDAAEKARLIQELTAKSAARQELVASKARLIIEAQQGSGLDLQRQVDLLQSLVERGLNARKNLQPPPRFELEEERKYLSIYAMPSAEEMLHDISPGASSLTQLNTTPSLQSELNPAVPLLSAQRSAVGVNVSHAVLSDYEDQREAEDAAWERQLQQLAVV
jgi:hypothetical protein